MRKLLAVVFILVLSTVAAFAQFSMGMPPVGQSGGALIESTPKGFFVLRNGVVVKFDAATMQVAGTKELFGPLPAMPQGDMRQNPGLFRDWFAEHAKRNAPAIMLPADNALVIVIGTTFFRVNQDTLAIGSQTELVPPSAPLPSSPHAAAMTMPPATSGYKLIGNTLYLLLPTELLGVNIEDGTVTTRTPLPAALIPQPHPPPRGNPGGAYPRRDNPTAERRIFPRVIRLCRQWLLK